MRTQTLEQHSTDILAPHAKRRLRHFLSAPANAISDALFELVYDDWPAGCAVSWQQAKAIERELEASAKTIGDVMAGWRPKTVRRMMESTS